MLETYRRRPRALPAVAVLLLAGLAAALLSPALRHQLAVSFQRQPAHYVELYFSDETTARACPVNPDGTTTVAVTVRSYLAAPAALPYVIELSAAGTSSTRTGTVATTPGTSAAFSATLPVPAAAYTVQVQLTGRSEHLVLHCGATS